MFLLTINQKDERAFPFSTSFPIVFTILVLASLSHALTHRFSISNIIDWFFMGDRIRIENTYVRIFFISFTVILCFIALTLFHLSTSYIKDVSTIIKGTSPMTRIASRKEVQYGSKDFYSQFKGLFLSSKELEKMQKLFIEVDMRKKMKWNNCVLLSGEPGTGKTEMAKMICRANGGGYIVSVSKLLALKSLGVQILEKLFIKSRTENFTLIFDDGDLGLIHRDISNTDHNLKVIVNYLLHFMSITTNPIIFTVNQDRIFDDAFSRRFQQHVVFKNPKIDKVSGILEKYLLKQVLEVIPLHETARLLEGLSIRDLRIIIHHVNAHYNSHRNLDMNYIVRIRNSFLKAAESARQQNINEAHDRYMKQHR